MNDQLKMDKNEDENGSKIEQEVKIYYNEPVVYNWKNITNEFKNACGGMCDI